jgi:hypothetical protein
MHAIEIQKIIIDAWQIIPRIEVFIREPEVIRLFNEIEEHRRFLNMPDMENRGERFLRRRSIDSASYQVFRKLNAALFPRDILSSVSLLHERMLRLKEKYVFPEDLQAMYNSISHFVTKMELLG